MFKGEGKKIIANNRTIVQKAIKKTVKSYMKAVQHTKQGTREMRAISKKKI